MKITTANNTKEEHDAAKILKTIVEKYNPPLFTDEVMIDSKAIPHSHPVLTLNTRDTEERAYLELLVHEQFHWFATMNPKYGECIEHLKTIYEDNGECNVTGRHPNSFWEHIIVCFNTRKTLMTLVEPEDIRYIYSLWQAYPKTEVLVRENFDEIEKTLEEFNMVYKS